MKHFNVFKFIVNCASCIVNRISASSIFSQNSLRIGQKTPPYPLRTLSVPVKYVANRASCIVNRASLLLLLAMVSSVNVWGAGTIADGTYVLCTSTSDLKAGDHYIIANGTSGSVNCISNVNNSNNRKTVSTSVSNSKITVASNSTVMTFTLGGSTGAWTFQTDNYGGTNGYLASAASGSNNYCRVISDATTATISFSDNAAVITLNPHTSRNILRYNSSASCFACYSSGQAAVYLYKKEAAASYTVNWTINPAAGGTLSATSGTSTTVTPNSAYTYGSPAYTVTSGTAAVSQSTNTFTATPSANCTIRINMVEKPKYKVTFNAGSGSCGKTSLTESSAGAGVTLPSASPSTSCATAGWEFAGWKETSAQAETTTKPTLLAAGTNYKPSANCTLYAVYKITEGESTIVLSEGFDNTTTSDASTAFNNSKFTNFSGATSYAYTSKFGGVKLGKSSTAGYITSKSLNLSSAFTVSLDACKYGSQTPNIEVTVGSTKKTISSSDLTAEGTFTNYSLSFDAATTTSTVKIGTSNERAYIDNVVVSVGSSTTTYNSNPSCGPATYTLD